MLLDGHSCIENIPPQIEALPGIGETNSKVPKRLQNETPDCLGYPNFGRTGGNNLLTSDRIAKKEHTAVQVMNPGRVMRNFDTFDQVGL
jgi:hypothetical protein